MHLQFCPSFSCSSHWEKIGLENEDTGLAKDLGKLGILSLTLFHTDSLSLSCHFFSWVISIQANKCSSVWPAPGQGSTKARWKMYLPSTLSRSGFKVRGMSALMGKDLTDSVTRFILVKNTLVVADSSQTGSQAVRGNTFSLPRAMNAAHNHFSC